MQHQKCLNLIISTNPESFMNKAGSTVPKKFLDLLDMVAYDCYLGG
jgi:hypothetical protein